MKSTRGYTLMEMIVTITVIGVIAAFAYPSYLRSTENAKATHAAMVVAQAGKANQAWALDHQGVYIRDTGTPGSGHLLLDCSSACCPDVPGCTDAVTACALFACHYMPKGNYDLNTYPYFVAVDDPATGTTCGNATFPVGSGNAACARRCQWSGGKACTTTAPYKDWAYGYRPSGATTAYGGAPSP